MTGDNLAEAVAANTAAIASITHALHVLFWWMAALTVFYVLGKSLTLHFQRRQRQELAAQSTEIAGVAAAVREELQISANRREAFMMMVPEAVREPVKEAVREAAADVAAGQSTESMPVVKVAQPTVIMPSDG